MRNKWLLRALLVLVLLGIVGYALYTARHILLGPQLLLGVPGDSLTVATQVIALTGAAQNTAELTLNNRKVLIAEDGTFTERMLLSAGVNTFIFEAHDKFDRSTTKTLQVVYVPKEDNVLQLKDSN